MHEVIEMASRSRKTPQSLTRKDRELENLLIKAFRKLNTRKRPSEIKAIGEHRPDKIK